MIHTATIHKKAFWFQAAALLIAGLAAWPLFSEAGLLNSRGGGDSPFLLQRLHQLTAALLDGHWPVRWMPDANYGYGYPFYNFYAPLSIYIAAVFRLIGFTYTGAIQLAQLAAFFTAGWAMYQLGQRWLGSAWAGLLASAAYTLAPFHLVNVYVRGDSLAEFWAMAFYPLLFWAVDSVVGGARAWENRGAGKKESSRRPPAGAEERQTPFHTAHARGGGRRSAIAWLGLAFAALVLSHNISALILTPFLLAYVALVSGPALAARGRPYLAAHRFRLPAALLLSLLFGLALSAWFWLPALAEQRLVQLAPVTAGYFHYSNHFRTWDLVQSSFLFDYEVAGGSAFRMGLLQAGAAVLGFVLLLLYPKSSTHSRTSALANTSLRFFIASGLLISTLMITPLSRPLWDELPLLPFTQFPWRFLSVQAFFAALAIGALAWLRWQRFLVPVLLALLLLTSLAGLQTDYLILSDADVTAEKLAQYEWFSGNIGSTVSAEYLPHTVQPRPYSSSWLSQGERNHVQVTDGRAQVSLQRRTATRQEWQIEAGVDGATLVLPTLYFAGWRATLDGEALPLQPAPGAGLIMADVPPGRHLLALHFGRTPVRRWGELLSLVALGGAIWLLWPATKARLRTHSPFWRPLVYAAAVLMPVLLLVRMWPQAAHNGHLRHWDFAQLGFLSHAPEGILFTRGQRLQQVSYSRKTVAAGEELLIRLHWSAGGGEATVALATPARHRFAQAPLLVTDNQTADGTGVALYRLFIPEDAPAGLYLPTLILADGSSPLTAAGVSRGTLFLEPVRVILAAGEPGEARSTLDVRAQQVVQRPQPLPLPPAGCSVAEAGGPVIDVHLAWLATRPLSHNYAVSLRLTDNVGRELAQCDSQPGYGFLPSSAWPAGQWLNDWLALPLPARLPEATPYGLTVRLYEVHTGAAVLTRRLGELVWIGEELAFRPTEPSFTLPAGLIPVSAVFERQIELRGYILEQTSDEIELTLYWQALAAGEEDFVHFVHLVDTTTGEVVAQHDAMPRRNSYPTSQWSATEIVADPLALALQGLPPGSYRLAVGLYRPIGPEYPRLTAVNGQNQAISDGRLFLPEIVILSEP